MPSELEAGDIILPPPQRPEQPIQRAVAPYVQSAVDAAWNEIIAPPGRVMQQKQPQAGKMWSDEEEAIRQANAAGELNWGANTALTMVGMPGGAGGLGSGIRAYHGSPHNFERFSTSKIGTGEGAQVYGHGLYFAENPTVAEDYKRSLGRRNPFEWEGKPVTEYSNSEDIPYHVKNAVGWLQGWEKPGESVVELIRRRIKDLSDHAEFMRNSSNSADRSSAGMYDSAVETLRRVDASKLKAPAGKMYEVDINADPEHFLDWDKPLSEQHPKVQEKLRDVGGLDLTAEDLKKHPEQLLEALELAVHQPGQGHLDRALAAQTLRERGIPGIKYLDQGSRQTAGGELIDVFKDAEGWKSKIRMNRPNGEQYFTTSMAHPTQEAATQWATDKITRQGTSNYVVFDEKLIDIIKKYGMAGLIAGGVSNFTPKTKEKKQEKLSSKYPAEVLQAGDIL